MRRGSRCSWRTPLWDCKPLSRSTAGCPPHADPPHAPVVGRSIPRRLRRRVAGPAMRVARLGRVSLDHLDTAPAPRDGVLVTLVIRMRPVGADLRDAPLRILRSQRSPMRGRRNRARLPGSPGRSGPELHHHGMTVQAGALHQLKDLRPADGPDGAARDRDVVGIRAAPFLLQRRLRRRCGVARARSAGSRSRIRRRRRVSPFT